MKILLSILFLAVVIECADAQDNRSLNSFAPLSNPESNRLLASGRFEVDQNSPNPFTNVTDIAFSSPVQCFVEFKVVNLIGKQVMRQVLEAEAGINNIHIEGADFMPGVYIYSLSNGSQTLTRRMVISKK